ncbi:hypothetical protein YC2023_116887 [Brassica napus]
MSSNLIPDVISGSSSVDNPRRDHQSGVGNITGMDFINFNWFIFSRTCFGNGEGLMCPESAAETNQEGLAYGFEIKRDGLKGPTRKYKSCRIIYQSDGNSETVDHTEARDQPKSLATTIFQFRSSQDIHDFWSIQALSDYFWNLESDSHFSFNGV